MEFLKAFAGLAVILLPVLSVAQQQKITGTVVNAQGNAVAGAAIHTSKTNNNSLTDARGVFSISVGQLPDTIVVTHVNYVTKQYVLHAMTQQSITIVLDEAMNELDETVVIAYGSTSKRYNTGSVVNINAKEIEKQPVGNVMQGLAGRMTGVVVTQQSGVPGSSIKLQVRGRGSITQGTEPMYIIDGVPFAAGNQVMSRNSSILTNAETGSGLNPFQSIAPGDIESIEVLKDADATAIYGSRGANGVVLITTKKGKQGKAKLDVNVYRSVSSLTRSIEMMNTQQYVAMRKEAFKNDNVAMTNTNAPDMLLWDTTRYTDFKKLLYGENAKTVNADISMSGGDQYTRYRVGGSYRNESTVIAGDMRSKRMAAHMQLSHATMNGKANIEASVNYSDTRNNLSSTDAGLFLASPPNLPDLYDNNGKLNWQQGGVNFTNPLYYQYRDYTTHTGNLLGRINAGWKPVKALQLRASMGYNTMRTDEETVVPMKAQNPFLNPTGSLEVGGTKVSSWIFEPQAELQLRAMKGRVTILAGGTMQENVYAGSSIKTSGYTSDNLINSLAAGPVTDYKNNNEGRYRYQALFARVQYNLQNTYLLNISGRRDGSSRFGTGNRYSTFGAVGAGWIFSNEGFVAKHVKVLSYGKLRGSYGTSGNDQIGDYQYMDAWTAAQAYQGTTALYPQNLYNPDYQWEVNKKLEAAIELGFYKDRLLLSVAWYRNMSGNQLVNYRLPTQTGFSGVTKNLDAKVQNSGVEIEVTSHNIRNKQVEWTTMFNVTIARNKLQSFPGLATSAYANTYVEGEPLNVIYRYHYTGVDTATGVFTFDDGNKDGVLNAQDYRVGGTTDPKYYGGMQNTVRYKGVELSVFAEFRKQQGRNYLYSLYSAKYIPGTMNNVPVLAMERWQQPGDVSEMQRYTTTTTSLAYRATNNFLLSDGIYSDASFIRIRNISLSYQLPAKWMKQLKMQGGQVYVHAQNVFTITKYKGSDPETQNLWQVPPLKTIAAGISLTL